MRFRALILVMLCMIAGAGLLRSGTFVSAALQDDATPGAEEEATPVAEDPAATPEAEPATQEVTLAYWYRLDEEDNLLRLTPLEYEGTTATRGQAENSDEGGRVNFADERNDDLPRIVFGDSTCDAYPVFPDDVSSAQRWIYFNDDPELRPATLVMQLVCVRGPYDNFEGTATFVSLGTDQGGILVLALFPPEEE